MKRTKQAVWTYSEARDTFRQPDEAGCVETWINVDEQARTNGNALGSMRIVHSLGWKDREIAVQRTMMACAAPQLFNALIAVLVGDPDASAIAQEALKSATGLTDWHPDTIEES